MNSRNELSGSWSSALSTGGEPCQPRSVSTGSKKSHLTIVRRIVFKHQISKDVDLGSPFFLFLAGYLPTSQDSKVFFGPDQVFTTLVYE